MSEAGKKIFSFYKSRYVSGTYQGQKYIEFRVIPRDRINNKVETA